MIKLVATDMDGTFLDENGTYDKKTFSKCAKKNLKNKELSLRQQVGVPYYHLNNYLLTFVIRWLL